MQGGEAMQVYVKLCKDLLHWLILQCWKMATSVIKDRVWPGLDVQIKSISHAEIGPG